MINKLICNKMKKIILIVVLGIILSTSTSYAVGNLLQAKEANLAQREVKLASKTATITQVQANISQDLKQRAQKEITRRLNFLNELLTRLNGIKKISSAEKADLQSQIQTQIDGLNALQTKINGDTDNTTLKTDVKSIINDYYIFLFFRVKVSLLIAADRMSTTTDNLSQIYTKLQTRINQAQAAGNDVTSLNAQLLDMNAKLTDANTQITAAQTELTSLTAQGYPGNKSTLDDARSKMKTAVSDLKTAYKDVLQIRQGLRDLKVKNPEASVSAH
jgi:predicted  nucleic acid-binding Zn-ribbon protein